MIGKYFNHRLSIFARKTIPGILHISYNLGEALELIYDESHDEVKIIAT